MSRQQLIKLCERLVNADETLSLKDIEQCTSNDSLFVKQIIRDLDDALTHYPGHLLTGKLDPESFKQSEYFATISLDTALLQLNLSDDVGLEIINFVKKVTVKETLMIIRVLEILKKQYLKGA